MILGDVEETVTTVEIDEETYEEIYKVSIETYTLYSVSFFHDQSFIQKIGRRTIHR